MKLSEDVECATIGTLQRFIDQAKQAGAAPTTPVHMQRNRSSRITTLTVEVVPGEESSGRLARLPGDVQEAINELKDAGGDANVADLHAQAAREGSGGN